ncbi:MAG TPA: hypothetical protein VLG38_03360, partial [Gammaproteobacteria bacterium]|nr:hypothetical protein [Gammaproteobacteria bacterium]
KQLGINPTKPTAAETYQDVMNNITGNNPKSALGRLKAIDKNISADDAYVLIKHVIDKKLNIAQAKELLTFLVNKAGSKLLTKDENGDNIIDQAMKQYLVKTTTGRASQEDAIAIIELLYPAVVKHISLRDANNATSFQAAVDFFKNASGSNFLIDIFEKLKEDPHQLNTRIVKLIDNELKAARRTNANSEMLPPILSLVFSALTIAKDSTGKNILTCMHDTLTGKQINSEAYAPLLSMLQSLYSQAIRSIEETANTTEPVKINAYTFDFANMYNVDLEGFTDPLGKLLCALSASKLSLETPSSADILLKFYSLHTSREYVAHGHSPYSPEVAQVVTPASLQITKYLLQLMNTEPKGHNKAEIDNFISNWLKIEGKYDGFPSLYQTLGEFCHNNSATLSAKELAQIADLLRSVMRKMQEVLSAKEVSNAKAASNPKTILNAKEVSDAKVSLSAVLKKRWTSDPACWNGIAISTLTVIWDTLFDTERVADYKDLLEFAVSGLQAESRSIPYYNILHHVFALTNDVDMTKDDKHTENVKTFLADLGQTLRAKDPGLIDALCRQRNVADTNTRGPLEMIEDTSNNNAKRKFVFGILKGTIEVSSTSNITNNKQ